MLKTVLSDTGGQQQPAPIDPTDIPGVEETIELAEGFWAQVLEVWNRGILGASVGELTVALLILLVFIAFRGPIAGLATSIVMKAVRRTKSDTAIAMLESANAPRKLLPVALGVYLSAEIVGLGGEWGDLADKLTQSLVAIAIFWGLANVVGAADGIFRPMERAISQVLADWVRMGLRIGFIAMGVVAVLQVWGIPVLPIVASFSLLSVAIALGAQNLFKNLIGGISIIAEHRFGPGDWILVDGVAEGTVEKVYFRSTKIRRFDRAPVYVPNAELSDAAVINFSRMQARRIRWVIGVEYRTSAEQLREIVSGIENYLRNEARDVFVQEGQPQFVKVDSFGPSSIDILIYCFTHTIAWGEWLEHKQNLAFAIKDIVEGAGTAFAFPSTSLYLESVPDELADSMASDTAGGAASTQSEAARANLDVLGQTRS